jgi:hypothetical protein
MYCDSTIHVYSIHWRSLPSILYSPSHLPSSLLFQTVFVGFIMLPSYTVCFRAPHCSVLMSMCFWFLSPNTFNPVEIILVVWGKIFIWYYILRHITYIGVSINIHPLYWYSFITVDKWESYTPVSFSTDFLILRKHY